MVLHVSAGCEVVCSRGEQTQPLACHSCDVVFLLCADELSHPSAMHGALSSTLLLHELTHVPNASQPQMQHFSEELWCFKSSSRGLQRIPINLSGS